MCVLLLGWFAAGFLFALVPLGFQHFFLGALAALSLLASNLFGTLALGAGRSQFDGFDLIGQDFPRIVAVHGLGARLLALDLNACGQVLELHARCDLIYILPAVAAAADERLGYILGANVEIGPTLPKRGFLFFADAKECHVIVQSLK